MCLEADDVAGFTKSSIILFLNKADVLAQKIQDPTQQIRDHFPDFSGKPGSFTDAVQYFQGRFQSLNRNAGKEGKYRQHRPEREGKMSGLIKGDSLHTRDNGDINREHQGRDGWSSLAPFGFAADGSQTAVLDTIIRGQVSGPRHAPVPSLMASAAGYGHHLM